MVVIIADLILYTLSGKSKMFCEPFFFFEFFIEIIVLVNISLLLKRLRGVHGKRTCWQVGAGQQTGQYGFGTRARVRI